MLMQKGNSQSEQNKRLDELNQLLSQKQKELQDYSKEVDALKESLHSEKQQVERLNNEKGKMMVKKKESEMAIGNQQKKLEFVT